MPCMDHWSDEQVFEVNNSGECSYEFYLHHYFMEVELDKLR